MAERIEDMLSINDIQIRDPFVLTVPEEGCYYLYGTTDKDPWGVHAQGFQAYKSSDLKIWEGPYPGTSFSVDFTTSVSIPSTVSSCSSKADSAATGFPSPS